MRGRAARAALALLLALALAGRAACLDRLRMHSAPRHARNQHIQQRAAALYGGYRSRLIMLPHRPRVLIFTCNSAQLCGGLGDRLKGLVSTFVLALLTDSEFMVDWEEPVPLRSAFALDTVPSDVAAVRVAAANASDFGFVDVHMSNGMLNHLRGMDFEALWAGRDVVNVRWNGALWNHLVLNAHLWEAAERYSLQTLSKRQVFELVMHLFLSKPTRDMAALADQSLAQMAGAPLRIGVQMRLGGEWYDPPRYKGSSLEETVDCFVREAVRACHGAACEGSCSVFLTTDSAAAQTAFVNATAAAGIAAVTSEGAITHLERSRGSNASDHLKTFADWWTLTRMSRLIASRSGFSETAGWAGNVPARALVTASACLFSNGVEVPDGAEY